MPCHYTVCALYRLHYKKPLNSPPTMRIQVALLHFKFQSRMTVSLNSHFSVKYFSEPFHLNLLSERSLIETSHCCDLGIVILKRDIYLCLCRQFNLCPLIKKNVGRVEHESSWSLSAKCDLYRVTQEQC